MSDIDNRATRVHDVLATGNVKEAMSALQREMNSVSHPEQRRQLLDALQRQNRAANDRDWSFPNVEITYNSNGTADVNFSHNVFEQAVYRPTQPFRSAAGALERK